VELAAIIGAIAAAAGTIGTGAWKIIDRADKKRQRREIKVEELLKARIAALEKAARAEARYADRVKAAAGSWREQLIDNKIKPDPKDWPQKEDDHE
jgi:hypothetical protein